MLLIVEGHRDNQLVEQGAGPLDDVQVPVCYWIKAAWINGDAHGRIRLGVIIPIRSYSVVYSKYRNTPY